VNQRQISKLNMLSPEQRVKYLHQIGADSDAKPCCIRKPKTMILPKRAFSLWDSLTCS